MTTIHSDHDIQPVIRIVKDALLHRLGDEVELIFQYILLILSILSPSCLVKSCYAKTCNFRRWT